MDSSSAESMPNHGVNYDTSTTTTPSTPIPTSTTTTPTDDSSRAFLPPGFDSMEEYIVQLQTFLRQCEPLTNLMIVDYFTTDSWETRMPREWREAFESPQGKLSSLELMELVSLGKLRDFIQKPLNESQHEQEGGQGSSGPRDWPESLKAFLRMVKTLSINRTLDPDYAKFKDTLDIHLIPGMSPKKLHEVEILSGLMAAYSKEHGIGSVIDLGAGQGYLSRVLAFQHQLCVLGVDSNTIQTCGAQTTQKRTEKLFVNKSRNKQQNNSSGKKATKTQKQAKANKDKEAKDKEMDGKNKDVKDTDTDKDKDTDVKATKSNKKNKVKDKDKDVKNAKEKCSQKPAKQQKQTIPSEQEQTLLSHSVSGCQASSTTTTTATTTITESTVASSATSMEHESSPQPSCPTSPPTQSTPLQPLGNTNTNTNSMSRPQDDEDESCRKISKKFKSEPGSSASGSDSGQGGPCKRGRKKRTRKAATAATTTTATTTVTAATQPTVDANINHANDSSSNTHMKADSIKEPSSSNDMTIDPSNDPQMAQTPGSNFQLQHITHTITAATLPTLLKEHFPKISQRAALRAAAAAAAAGASATAPSTESTLSTSASLESCQTVDSKGGEVGEEDGVGRWTLCGLHACGDLTSNMIKLYLESSATCLFSVGCCYHWLTERYDKDGNVVLDDGTHGFPLSKVFNRHQAHLGDHAKMIACQSPERWLKYQKESEDAIHGHYFRALLHKLMVEKGLCPGPPAIAPVLGRMGKHRLKGFPHYMATALQRLNMPKEAITVEEAQAAYNEFLERDVYRIGILWALRTMLGPLFEGMILLDRAMHLHETIVGDDEQSSPNLTTTATKPKMGSVRLVAGFDVVESPRNMILIALKD
ncbi:hypothetical protein BGZ94_009169 [Podila epigama]|nr:hypothetical protein BGZ94_009169 [Podila epigama]